MLYSGATIVLGLIFPFLEYRYLKDFAHGVTVPVATALFSSIASGMLALTGIVFSLAFVMVQFSSAAYSPVSCCGSVAIRSSGMAWAFSPPPFYIL